VAEPAPTKKRRKKRGVPQEPPRVAESERKGATRGRGRFLWIAIAAFGLAELWLFGAKGDIRVCVARDGEHDFSLVDTPRTEDNTQRYPSCERRLNVGLRSHFEERVEDAMLHACRRATILRGKEATIACALEEAGWTHRVEAKWVPPWDAAYYKRLFWFFF
jgi:hypothetical protein